LAGLLDAVPLDHPGLGGSYAAATSKGCRRSVVVALARPSRPAWEEAGGVVAAGIAEAAAEARNDLAAAEAAHRSATELLDH
jgi:hypothetical protein